MSLSPYFTPSQTILPPIYPSCAVRTSGGVLRESLVEEHVQISPLMAVYLLDFEPQTPHGDFPVLGLFHNLRDGDVAVVACGITKRLM